MLAAVSGGSQAKSLICLMFVGRPGLAWIVYTGWGMTSADRRLLRHLVVAVVIKLIVLTALWWLFVRDTRVTVDATRIDQRLGGVTSSQGASK